MSEIQQTETYISKDHASRMLGLSGRRTADYAQRGIIERRFEVDNRIGRKVALFKQSDVMRLAAELKAGAARPGLPVASEARLLAASLGAPAENQRAEVIDGARRLLSGSAPAAPPEPRPWLELSEAAEISGLPARLLARIIRAGELRAIKYKAGLLVHREDLAGWRPGSPAVKNNNKTTGGGRKLMK